MWKVLEELLDYSVEPVGSSLVPLAEVMSLHCGCSFCLRLSHQSLRLKELREALRASPLLQSQSPAMSWDATMVESVLRVTVPSLHLRRETWTLWLTFRLMTLPSMSDGSAHSYAAFPWDNRERRLEAIDESQVET